MPDINPPALPEMLQWRPWWNHGDPVPDWIINRLDKVAIVKLATIQVELNRAILDAQSKALAGAQEILRGMK